MEASIARLQKSISIVHNPIVGWLIFGIALIFTVAAYHISSSQMQTRADTLFRFRVAEITTAIIDRMALYEQALRGGVGLFNASESVTRAEWHHYVDSIQLKERLPGIQGMGFAIPVTASEKAQHIAAIRDEGFPEFTIKPEGERSEYSSIIYLEPFDWRNQRAFGYDMWSNEMRRQAMARARDNGEVATSGIITLVQETDSDVQKGFLTYVPVYQAGMPTETIEQRQASFMGWVYAAFRVGDLMRGILGSEDTNLAFSIYDGDVVDNESLLFASHSDLAAPVRGLDFTQHIELQGRPWTILFSSSRTGLLSASEVQQPLYILIAGIIVDSLLLYVLFSLYWVNKHARNTANKMIEEYGQSQNSLALQAKLVEATEKESQTFFELAPDAFLVVNHAGKIVKANQQAHDMFGYDQGELVGNEVEMLIPAASRADHQRLREGYQRKPSSRTMRGGQTLEGLRRGDTVFPVTINLVALEFQGEMHTVVAVHDISVQKHIEETLAEAKEKAESASRSKSEFVANMSHEIRTPMNAVLGAAQLLSSTELTDIQQKYTTMIKGSGEALLGIINDILDFSKVEAGKMELTSHTFVLDEVLTRVALMMSVNAGDKLIDLVIDVAPDVPRELIGDALRLQQVLINLTSNAIKFTESGEVVLWVKTVMPQPSEQDGGKVRLTFGVRDSGIGMDKEQQQRLFSAFSQADNSITRRFGGTGLGLVISNRIVELMGSAIELESLPGEGTCFYFSVDVAVPEVLTESHLPDWAQVSQGMLVIEPNASMRSSISAIAEYWQWRVFCFASIGEACQQLNPEDQTTIDFVILDTRACGVDKSQRVSPLVDLALPAHCAVILSITHNQNISDYSSISDPWFHSTVSKPVTESMLLAACYEGHRALMGDDSDEARSAESVAVVPLKNIRILLAEDNRLNQVIAEGILGQVGVKLTIVNNGQEAIDIIRSSPHEFALILMDIQMPILDGVSATAILRQELGCTIPIVAMTAGVLQSEQQQYLEAGMDDFVAKPIDSEALYDVIARQLRRVEKLRD